MEHKCKAIATVCLEVGIEQAWSGDEKAKDFFKSATREVQNYLDRKFAGDRNITIKVISTKAFITSEG